MPHMHGDQMRMHPIEKKIGILFYRASELLEEVRVAIDNGKTVAEVRTLRAIEERLEQNVVAALEELDQMSEDL